MANLGGGLVGMGRLEDAVTVFDRAIEIDARNAAAWANKGNALGQLHQFREALVCFERAAELGDPEAAGKIALCHKWLNR
jgi:tetratricopeptide (TPR) repeat protein